ncbi:MAG TPA: hypothetical protein VF268_14585 [Gammaproteobacteria bacterium]
MKSENSKVTGFCGWKWPLIPLALSLAAFAMGVRPAAAAGPFAVDVHGGSLGTGVGASFRLTGNLNVRAGINSGEFELVEIEDDDGLNYDNPTFEFDNQFAFLDWYPSKRSNFRFSLGVVQNNNEITASAFVDTSGQFVGDTEAPPNTSVHGRISFEGTAGYAGIGWGNAFGRNKGFHLGIDLGVMSQGDPQVDVVVIDDTNTVSEEDVEQERQDLENELEGIDLWPVLNVSLGFRF